MITEKVEKRKNSGSGLKDERKSNEIERKMRESEEHEKSKKIDIDKKKIGRKNGGVIKRKSRQRNWTTRWKKMEER